MKTGVSLIVILYALLFSHFAHARAGWTNYVNVAELVPRARLYYEVKLPVKMNPSGCREANWFYQNYGSLGSSKMFDILLEGIKSGIRMRVYVTGVCNLNGYSEFSAISVIP
jgi:hypothetical protein